MVVSDYGVSIMDATLPETLDIAIPMPPTLFPAALRHFMEGGKDARRRFEDSRRPN